MPDKKNVMLPHVRKNHIINKYSTQCKIEKVTLGFWIDKHSKF